MSTLPASRATFYLNLGTIQPQRFTLAWQGEWRPCPPARATAYLATSTPTSRSARFTSRAAAKRWLRGQAAVARASTPTSNLTLRLWHRATSWLGTAILGTPSKPRHITSSTKGPQS